jgi:hypothetical protein
MPLLLFQQLTDAAKERGGYRAIEQVQFDLADPYQLTTTVGRISLRKIKKIIIKENIVYFYIGLDVQKNWG